mmetsp:Transcript_28134/g.39115  ORF Transcript_28134/g.39115 Transcript_28134/m.39115 type:complete len:249 (-) Transcript_28134:138-884(-)
MTVDSRLVQSNAIISASIGSLSILGGLSVLLSSLAFKKFRSQSRALICMLSTCNIMQGAFFVLMAIRGNEADCHFYTSFGIIAAASEFIMTTCISFSVFYMLVQAPRGGRMSKWQLIIFPGLVFGYPSLSLIVTSLLWPKSLTERPHEETSWCFIPYRFPFARIMTVYIPLFLCWGLTIIFCYRSIRILVFYERGISQGLRGGTSSRSLDRRRRNIKDGKAVEDIPKTVPIADEMSGCDGSAKLNFET